MGIPVSRVSKAVKERPLTRDDLHTTLTSFDWKQPPYRGLITIAAKAADTELRVYHRQVFTYKNMAAMLRLLTLVRKAEKELQSKLSKVLR